MTKEELRKEAENNILNLKNNAIKVSGKPFQITEGDYIQGYLDGAEPREKRIEDLEETINKLREQFALRYDLEDMLKKENAELKKELTKKADTNHSLVEQMADLESENAELKKKYVNNITDCEICDTYCNSQLIKAIKIIKEFIRLEYADFTNGDYSNELSKVLEQAEQFLKEIE